MAETAGEQTFAPTAKRRSEAARNGDVLRSREVATAATVMTGALWLKYAGLWLFSAMARAMRDGLAFNRASLDHFDPGTAVLALTTAILPPIMVLGGVIMLAGIASQLVLGDGRWNAGNLAPRLSRINPLTGLSRLFGIQGLIELGKGLAKLAVLGTLAWIAVKDELRGLVGLGNGTIAAGSVPAHLLMAWNATLSLLIMLAAGLIIIALIDFPIQAYRRMQRLKMSLQELRDESKDSEGSPERKGAIRNRQRQIAMAGVQKAMKKAQFLVTNPQHYAVAMAYDPDLAPAPVVLAKGRGEKALAMRELAAEMAVPCLEYPALARSLYFTTRERQMIREELYMAVAAVLAFVLSIRRGETPPAPVVEVPLGLRFDAQGRPEVIIAS